jgi:N-acetylglutamate synthase-like GNAT family acetyltransferase
MAYRPRARLIVLRSHGVQEVPVLNYRPAVPLDVAECIVLRGLTRENAIRVARLASLGITLESWTSNIETARVSGHVCTDNGRIVGYCFGDRHTGEIGVLALLPAYESRGIGKALLLRVVEDLWAIGFKRLFLGCSKNPAHRSYGFYRYLGWRSTGKSDAHGDEELELLRKD